MRNKYNANFYEENKYYNTNQNDTDNKLDNENKIEGEIGAKSDYPNPDVEFAKESEDDKRINKYDHYPNRNNVRNLK